MVNREIDKTIMNNNKRWDRLMEINNKSCTAINSLKENGNNAIEISLALEELYEIASLSGNEATILRRDSVCDRCPVRKSMDAHTEANKA